MIPAENLAEMILTIMEAEAKMNDSGLLNDVPEDVSAAIQLAISGWKRTAISHLKLYESVM